MCKATLTLHRAPKTSTRLSPGIGLCIACSWCVHRAGCRSEQRSWSYQGLRLWLQPCSGKKTCCDVVHEPPGVAHVRRKAFVVAAHMHMYMYIYIHKHIYNNTCFVCKCIYTYIYIYIHVYIYIYMHIHISKYMYVCIYWFGLYVHINIYIYICMYKQIPV